MVHRFGSQALVLEFEEAILPKHSSTPISLNLENCRNLYYLLGSDISLFELPHMRLDVEQEVTIVHRGKTPWKILIQDIVKRLISATKKLGIKLILKKE